MDLKQKFKIYWDKENEITVFEMNKSVNQVDEDLANYIYKEAFSFLNSRPEEQINILVDVASSQPSGSKVRKILAKTLKIDKIAKIAFCSTNKIQRVIVDFVARAAGKDNTRTFDSRKEAINWLKK